MPAGSVVVAVGDAAMLAAVPQCPSSLSGTANWSSIRNDTDTGHEEALSEEKIIDFLSEAEGGLIKEALGRRW